MRTLIIILLGLIANNVIAQESNPYIELRKETYVIQSDYLKSIAEHQKEIINDLEKKLKQQKWQTVAIAIIVYIMVGLGLYLSYLQFKRDEKEGTNSSIDFSLGAGSIKIKSSVIGIVILAMSFWFFQTYIDKVYNVDIEKIPPIDFTTFGVDQ